MVSLAPPLDTTGVLWQRLPCARVAQGCSAKSIQTSLEPQVYDTQEVCNIGKRTEFRKPLALPIHIVHNGAGVPVRPKDVTPTRTHIFHSLDIKRLVVQQSEGAGNTTYIAQQTTAHYDSRRAHSRELHSIADAMGRFSGASG